MPLTESRLAGLFSAAWRVLDAGVGAFSGPVPALTYDLEIYLTYFFDDRFRPESRFF